jgi:hypothetical protein
MKRFLFILNHHRNSFDVFVASSAKLSKCSSMASASLWQFLFAAAIYGGGGGNLARPRWGCVGDLWSNFFGQWSKRGASSAVVVALEGGRRARVGFEDGYGCAKRGWGHFSNMARGADASDRLLPRTEAGSGALTVYYTNLGYRWCTNFTPG